MKKYFLFLILFIFPLYVKAYYNDGFGLTLSEDGVFYSLNTYPSKTNIGYHVSSVLYPTGDGWGAKPPESASASYGTNGGMFVQCGMSFVPDNYYSVTYVYLFNGYSSYLHPFYTAWKNHLAIGTNNAVEHSQDYVTASDGVQYSCVGTDCYGSFTIIFKPDVAGTCLGVAYSSILHNSSMNDYIFIGYDFKSLGSSLSSTDIKNALQSNFDNLNQNLLNVQNSINSNINDMKDKQDQTNQKLDETNDKLQEQNEMQKEQNDYLMDDTPPNSDVSSLGNVQGLLPPGPLDSLLNIPFQFLSIINSSFGGVCKALDIDFVYDTTLSIPCFSEMFYNDVPPLLLNFLSLIPSAFILIQYFKHLYKKVDRAMNMESNADDEWGVI